MKNCERLPESSRDFISAINKDDCHLKFTPLASPDEGLLHRGFLSPFSRAMTFFLLSYLIIYSTAHLYLLHKLKKAELPVFRHFREQNRATFLSLLLILFLVTAPILVRMLERMAMEGIAESLAYFSYIWMGLLFLFIALAAFTDLFLLPFRIAGRMRAEPVRLSQTRKILLLQVLMVSAIFCYGLYEARTITTEYHEIISHKLPEENGVVRLAQISDVHLGLMVGERRLASILGKIEEEKPDLLVSTGDLVDSRPAGLEKLSRMLVSVTPPLGKLAVTGNHEFYAGLDSSLAFTREAGFQILRGRSITLAGISFSGIDDSTASSFGLSEVPNAGSLLEHVPAGQFKVLLKHRPEIDGESAGHFDLQLSGHTHRGQIFPFNLVTRLFYPRATGLSRTEGGSYLYHSRGSGTWGPPVRFLSPPEVTIIDLKPD